MYGIKAAKLTMAQEVHKWMQSESQARRDVMARLKNGIKPDGSSEAGLR